MNYILLGNKNHSFYDFYATYEGANSCELDFPFEDYKLVFNIDDVPDGMFSVSPIQRLSLHPFF